MSLENLLKELVAELRSQLGSDGFNRCVGQSVRRDAAVGWQSVHLNVSKWDELVVNAHCSVRFDDVEAYLDRYDPERQTLSARERQQIATVGGELGLIGERPNRPLTWHVARSGDVEPIAAQIASVTREIALPFFASVVDLSGLVDALLHREIISPLPSKRAKQLVALSDLTHRIDLRRLVEAELGKLKEFERKQVTRLLEATKP